MGKTIGEEMNIGVYSMKENEALLTQEYLKSILDYNPETGIFTWKIRPAYCINIGDIAGCLNKNDGYIRIQINNKSYQAHRLVWLYMTGNCPIKTIDHINHIRTDNRIINLRDITQRENQYNRSENKNNSSGYKGVSWHKKANKWHARIRVNGKQIHLGYFTDKEEASQAYQEAKEKYHIIEE